jgi:hypothetical protein
MGTTMTMYAAGGELRRGGLLGEEECEVEDREWSITIIAAAANANPQPTSSVVLDKTPGGRLMREYKSIVTASAYSSFGNDDDDGMSIYDDFDGGDDFDNWGEVGGLNEGEYGGVRSPILPTATMTTTTTTRTRTENPATSTAATG